MSIRTATSSDFEKLLQIAERIFSGLEKKACFNWPEHLLRTELRNVTTTLVSESESGEILGFLCFRQMPDFYEISVLATDPAAQKTGVQTRLIQHLQGLAAKQRIHILLEVHHENERALSLYLRQGFLLIHSRQNYYQDGAEALVFKWAGLNKAGC